ncbi:prostaglandin E synthase-like [Watersipora subatra]|uniref:prostaglandin E synthase-like n=1 Tax=Watersipora subatra TaxID=2589382 RepID=UPI00355AE306
MADADDEQHLSGNVNPWVMSSYITYSSLLLMKLLFNILLIIATRLRTKIVPNPEDKGSNKELKVGGTHPLLTRVQRMQQNDLENIIPFLMIGFAFVMTWYSPYSRAVWHFRIFFISRMLMSFCHYFSLQPFRSIFFLIAMCTNISMGGHVLYKAAAYSVKYF